MTDCLSALMLQSRREAAALRDRVSKLKEDGEDAKRIANELDAEVKVREEAGGALGRAGPSQHCVSAGNVQ